MMLWIVPLAVIFGLIALVLVGISIYLCCKVRRSSPQYHLSITSVSPQYHLSITSASPQYHLSITSVSLVLVAVSHSTSAARCVGVG